MDEAEHLADRVGVVVRGRLVALGTPAELGAGRHEAVVSFRLPAGVDVADLPALDGAADAAGAGVGADHRPPHRRAAHADRLGRSSAASTCRPSSVRRPSLEDVYLALVGDQAAAEARRRADR